MSDLLPCPFCGGTDLDPLANCVVCLDCGARGPTQEEIEILCDPDLAKEQWNRRALPSTDARAKVAKLVKALDNADKFFATFQTRMGGRDSMSYIEKDLLDAYLSSRAALSEAEARDE